MKGLGLYFLCSIASVFAGNHAPEELALYRQLCRNAESMPEAEAARARRNTYECSILRQLNHLKPYYPPLMGMIADMACRQVEIGNLEAQPVANLCVDAAKAACRNSGKQGIIWIDPLVVLHKKWQQADAEGDHVGRYIQAMLPPGSKDYQLVQLGGWYAMNGLLIPGYVRRRDSAGAVYFQRIVV